MSLFRNLVDKIIPSRSTPQATRDTSSVMGEFLEAFGPIEEARTEEVDVLDALMPEVHDQPIPDSSDPLADWGKG